MAQDAKTAGSPPAKANVVVIFGDDIGIANLSAYSDGLMGYTTPNIDRIAEEGARFLQYYGEQSCTAGRAAFLTGQHGLRTGLTKVGYPGAPMGLSQLDPTVAVVMKNLGYATGQFGKNHVGDRNETLPTVNGFDEFFGNLYHLNAEEEPSSPTIPKILPTWPSSGRGACLKRPRQISMTPRSIHASARLANRRLSIPVL